MCKLDAARLFRPEFVRAGPDCRLGAITYVELAQDCFHKDLDRRFADLEVPGDMLVLITRHQATKHCVLTFGEIDV
jgi:hypothetical protein